MCLWEQQTGSRKTDFSSTRSSAPLFPPITLQDWVGWGILSVILGYPRRASGDSQHLEARSELQDWLWFQLSTVKNYRTGPFSKDLGNNIELYSIQLSCMPGGCCRINANKTWGEPSMDQDQPRGKHLTNFQGHRSIQIFPESAAPRNWSIRTNFS